MTLKPQAIAQAQFHAIYSIRESETGASVQFADYGLGTGDITHR
jgi:hypothetical protein